MVSDKDAGKTPRGGWLKAAPRLSQNECLERLCERFTVSCSQAVAHIKGKLKQEVGMGGLCLVFRLMPVDATFHFQIAYVNKIEQWGETLGDNSVAH